MNWDNNLLKIFGLREIEKNILSALSVPKNINEVVQTTRFSRTGINYSLKQLVEKELVVVSRIKKQKYYRAITIQEFSGKIKNILSMNGVVEKKAGVKLKTAQANEVSIHIGPSEIVPAYCRIASENKNERIRAIQHSRSFAEIFKVMSVDQLAAFNDAIKRNHLIIEGLLNESAYAAFAREIKKSPLKYQKAAQSLEGRMADYAMFADDVFNYSAEIWLFKSTTLIINWQEAVAIEIIDKNITTFLKDMFEFVKRGSRKIDHNQAMRKLIQQTN